MGVVWPNSIGLKKGDQLHRVCYIFHNALGYRVWYIFHSALCSICTGVWHSSHFTLCVITECDALFGITVHHSPVHCGAKLGDDQCTVQYSEGLCNKRAVIRVHPPSLECVQK